MDFKGTFFYISVFSISLIGCDSGGNLGEDCTARTDCASGLACVSGECTNDTSGRTVTGSMCKVIGCLSDFDCGDNNICIEGLCAQSCGNDDDCGSSNVCVSQICVDCADNDDCGIGGRCVDNTCWGECSTSGECPVFFDCVGSMCEHKGCQSDGECYWLVDNAFQDLVCYEGECKVGCDSDLHCGSFNVCHDGVCMSPGCDSDTECKAAIYPSGFPASVIGVECVDQETNPETIYANPYGYSGFN